MFASYSTIFDPILLPFTPPAPHPPFQTLERLAGLIELNLQVMGVQSRMDLVWQKVLEVRHDLAEVTRKRTVCVG